jgi:hypothetical protein
LKKGDLVVVDGCRGVVQSHDGEGIVVDGAVVAQCRRGIPCGQRRVLVGLQAGVGCVLLLIGEDGDGRGSDAASPLEAHVGIVEGESVFVSPEPDVDFGEDTLKVGVEVGIVGVLPAAHVADGGEW